jgi:hypothetical protein
MLSKRLREIYDDLSTVLKWPLLVALFGFNAFFVIPLSVLSIGKYGVVGLGFLFAAESPAIFLVAHEAWRRWQLEPATDRWETSSEKWNEAFNDYVKMIDETESESTKR